MLTRSGITYNRRLLYQVIAIMLSLIMCVGTIVVGANLFVKADISQEQLDNATEIVFSDGAYQVPVSGLSSTPDYKYTNGEDWFVFRLTQDLIDGDTLTLNADGTITETHNDISNAENILNESQIISSDQSGVSFRLNDDALLENGRTYYYHEDGTQDYYFFTMQDDFGSFTETDADLQTVVKERVLNTEFRIDKNDNSVRFTGDKLTKHTIYVKTNSFDSENTYLLYVRYYQYRRSGWLNLGWERTGYSKDYLLKYGESIAGTTESDQNNVFSGCINDHGSPYYSMEPYLPTDGEIKEADSQIFYDASGNRYTVSDEYFDGGTGISPYLNCELSTYSTIGGFWGDGKPLAGTDNDTGLHSLDKCLGTPYGLTAGGNLYIHRMCRESGWVSNHNYGDLWTYDSRNHTLTNSNAHIGNIGYGTYLGFEKSTSLEPESTFTVVNGSDASEVFLYRLTYVYDKEDIDFSETVSEYQQTNILTPEKYVVFRDATLTFNDNSSNPIQNQSYNVTLRLIDEDGNEVDDQVTYGDLSFANGICSFSISDNQVKNVTHIPDGYQIVVDSICPSYGIPEQIETAYTYNQVSSTNVFVIGETNALGITVNDTRKDIGITSSIETPFENSSLVFPLSLTLKKDGNLYDGTLYGNDGVTTYNFANGVYSTTINKGDNISDDFDIMIPEGFELTITISDPNDSTIPSNYYSYSINDNEESVSPNSASVVVDDNVSIPILIKGNLLPVSITNETVGEYANFEKDFPLKLTLMNGATPVSDTFLDTNGNEYVFSNGVCESLVLGKDETVTLQLPVGYSLTVADSDSSATELAGYWTTTFEDSDTENNGQIIVNGVNSAVTIIHTRNTITDTGLKDGINPLSHIILVVLVVVAAAGFIYLVFLKRKLRIQ